MSELTLVQQMSSKLSEFTARRDKLSKKIKIGGGLLVVVLIPPLMFFIAQVILGTAAVLASGALAFLVGIIVINAMPVASMKIANWRLRALKAEAERNPIETLQSQQLELVTALDNEANAIKSFDTEVSNFRSSLQKELDNGFPDAAASGLPTLQNMEKLLSFRRVKYKRAQARIVDRAKKIELAESKWRVALAAQKVTAASGETNLNALGQILESIAFGSVESAVNTSMAELRTAIMVEEVPADDKDVIDMPAQIEHNPSQGLDLKVLQQALAEPNTVEGAGNKRFTLRA